MGRVWEADSVAEAERIAASPELLLAGLRTVRDGGLVVGPHLPDAHRVLAAPTTAAGWAAEVRPNHSTM